MYLFTYSYKADSLDEIIGMTRASSIKDAIELISKIKQLSKRDVIKLFNVRKVSI